MHIKFYRKAFTMLELIFVIVILGIVASIGSSIIVQVYESYIIQRAVHNASLKTELAINQLSNRLSYRIDVSMLARKPSNNGYSWAGPDPDIYPIFNVPIGQQNNYTGMEWINYDNDGFAATTTPGWSGFVDLDASDSASIKSIGSDLGQEQTILTNLGIVKNPAIIFRGTDEYKNNLGVPSNYDALNMYNPNGSIFPVTLAVGDVLTFAGGDRTAGQMVYSEFYQLATSAYAVVPERNPAVGAIGPNGGSMITTTAEVWDLRFYYNYQPWILGSTIVNAPSSILLKNVSVFRFKQEIHSIRIKLCSIEPIGDDNQISICKEKAVIR